MAEYIKREALVDLVLGKLKFMGDARIMNKGDEKVLSEIDGYEKAIYAVHELLLDKDLIEDIQSVKRGHWYDVGAEYIKEIGQFKIHAFCSKCHRLNYHLSDYSQNMEAEFCQHCGADMRSPEALKG